MSDLVPFSVQPLAIVSTKEEKEYFDSIPDDSFLPSIKLLQGTNPELSDPKNQQGDYYLTLHNKNLGKKFKTCIIGRRAHALLMLAGKKAKESFNIKSPIFAVIRNTKSTQDQAVRASYGHDFLCYLPEDDVFATFFLGQKALRPAGLLIEEHRTKPEERHISKAELEYTNCFEIWSYLKKFGPRFQCMAPGVTPLPPEKQYFPSEEAATGPLEIFYRPVQQEVQVTVVQNPTDVGR